MESEKRKRIEKEIDEEKKQKVSVKDEESSATVKADADEEEVEEFFAILRRMQVARKYFGKEWRATAETTDLTPVLPAEVVVQDNEEEEGDVKEEIRDKSNGVPDLNAQPDE